MGYVKRHWKGENSLLFAFWGNFVFVSIIYNVVKSFPAYFILIEALGGWITYLVISIGLTVWQTVGTWRSATNYFEQAFTDKTKVSLWAGLAKFVIVLSLTASFLKFAGEINRP